MQQDGCLDAQSSLTGTNFQYHLEGDCSGSRGGSRRECQQTGHGRTAPDTPSHNIHGGASRPLRSKSCPVPMTWTPSITTRLTWKVTGTSTTLASAGAKNTLETARAGHREGQTPTAARRGAQCVVCAHLKNKEAHKSVAQSVVPMASPESRSKKEARGRRDHRRGWATLYVHSRDVDSVTHLLSKKLLPQGKKMTEMSRMNKAPSVSFLETRNIICLNSMQGLEIHHQLCWTS